MIFWFQSLLLHIQRIVPLHVGYTSLRWLREVGPGVESCTGVTADRRMLRAMVDAGLGWEAATAVAGEAAGAAGVARADAVGAGAEAAAGFEVAGAATEAGTGAGVKYRGCRLLLMRWTGGDKDHDDDDDDDDDSPQAAAKGSQADAAPPIPRDFNVTALYDVVLADYLVGAVEGFEPYAQRAVLAMVRSEWAVVMKLRIFNPYSLPFSFFYPSSPEPQGVRINAARLAEG